MSFQTELEAICSEVPGCRTAVVMSLDGISVANHVVDAGDLDIEALLIELIGPLKQAIGVMKTVAAGELATFEVSTADAGLLVRLLSEEYFIALVLKPDAITGRGRYAVRAHATNLREELV
jgi:predicted regulator of Ras-like GTPase activity (Roadblock/LC7/MglB family)